MEDFGGKTCAALRPLIMTAPQKSALSYKPVKGKAAKAAYSLMGSIRVEAELS